MHIRTRKGASVLTRRESAHRGRAVEHHQLAELQTQYYVCETTRILTDVFKIRERNRLSHEGSFLKVAHQNTFPSPDRRPGRGSGHAPHWTGSVSSGEGTDMGPVRPRSSSSALECLFPFEILSPTPVIRVPHSQVVGKRLHPFDKDSEERLWRHLLPGTVAGSALTQGME